VPMPTVSSTMLMHRSAAAEAAPGPAMALMLHRFTEAVHSRQPGVVLHMGRHASAWVMPPTVSLPCVWPCSQDRNTAGSTFGGHVLREAFESAFCVAAIHAGAASARRR